MLNILENKYLTCNKHYFFKINVSNIESSNDTMTNFNNKVEIKN